MMTSSPQRKNSAIERGRSTTNCAPITNNNYAMEIPIIDLSNPNSEEIASQLWNAAHNVGFFTLINHSIPQHQIDTLFTLSEQFFGLDSDTKHQYQFDREKNSGYEFMTQKPPSTNVVDLKETFQVTAREGCMDQLWPSDVVSLQQKEGEGQQQQGFQEVIMDMIANAHALACRVLSLLESRACPHVERGTLPNAHHIWGEDGQCTLRLLHYPPTIVNVEDEQNEGNHDNESTQINTENDANTRWRCGAHTDWGSLTLLFQRVGEDGLECRRRDVDEGVECTSATWVEVPPEEGGITVNIGDMLKRWSDCKLYSNMHRVRMPKTSEECAKSRYSVAFFLQADKSALIENISNEPITAGDYFAARINAHFSE